MFKSRVKGKKKSQEEKKEKFQPAERVLVRKEEGKPAPSFEEMRAFLIGGASEEEMDLLWSVGYKEDRLLEIHSPNRQAFVWSEEEVHLILHFYYDQRASPDRMAQLLQQKGLE